MPTLIKGIIHALRVMFINFAPVLQIGKCPTAYREWLVTMYCQFGGKWANLHLGPMWKIVSATCTAESASSTSVNPMEVSLIKSS